MGRNYPVYGSHAYAEGHFIHVGIQCFLVLETSHHRLILCVKDSTHTTDQLIVLSDLGVFQHSYPSGKQDKGDDAYFQLLDRNRKSPALQWVQLWPIGFPILTDHKILPYPLLNRRV